MVPRLSDVANSHGPPLTRVQNSSFGPLHIFIIATLVLTGILFGIFYLQPKLTVGPGLLLGSALTMLLTFLLALFVEPYVSLVLAIALLASPFPLLLGNIWSALVAGGLLGMAFLGTAFRSGFSRLSLRDPMPVLCWAFVLFGSFSAIRGIWAGNRLDWAIGDAFQIAEFALAYILVDSLVTRREVFYALTKWVGGTAIFTIVFELILPFLGLGSLLPSWEETVSRTINMGAMFVLILLLNLYAVDGLRLQRPWIWVLLVLAALNILLSLTRSLWLGSLIAVGASAFLLAGNARRKVLRNFGILVCCLLLSAAVVQIGGGSALNVFQERVTWGESQVQKALSGEESLATRRFMEFVIISPELLTEPFLGKGLGAQYAIGSFAIADPGDVDVVDHHYIHNLFLMVAFRLGIIGLLLFGGILFCYFRRGLKACRKLPAGSNRALVAGLVASVLGQLALSMTWPTILDHPTAGLTGCAMALTFVLCRLEIKEQAANGAKAF